jgi:hypothetical protein
MAHLSRLEGRARIVGDFGHRAVPELYLEGEGDALTGQDDELPAARRRRWQRPVAGP